MHIATTGAALSGNKGAASMIEALAREFGERDGHVSLLTTYPAEDRLLAEGSVEVVGLPAWRLPVVDVPLAAIARVLPSKARRFALLTPALKAVDRADVVADISGVSFVDDRGLKFHVYNALLTALPMLLETPVVKCSQAMGPFEQRVNRMLARALLPKVSRVLGRGARSRDHLIALGLRNVEEAADLAFTLDHARQLPAALEQELRELRGDGVILVMPSAVVEAWCERHDIDHTAVLAQVIDQVCAELGVGVVLAPHAYRKSGKPRRMHDGRVCNEVAQRLGSRPDVLLVDEDLSPAILRSLVAHADLLVTSRFHGMISGLASCTPTVVIGWSHKYEEVLAQFGAQDLALDYSALRDPSAVAAAIVRAWKERDQLRERLAEALPPVRASAERNFAVLREVGTAP